MPAIPELSALFQLGGIGAIVAFLLLKTEPRMKSMEAAIDRGTRGQILFILAFEQVSGALKTQATALLEEIHDAEKERAKGA